MPKTIIGVMGPGDGATQKDLELATELGRLIAQQGWALLTGGRNIGVMNAASKGAHEAGGLTIGILPTEDPRNSSPYLDLRICTGMGSARNNINVLSSDVVIACGTGPGTSSEIMLALKAQKPIILLNQTEKALSFIDEMAPGKPKVIQTPKQAVRLIVEIL
ncbi:MAG TPA: TIGR00725 family protein [Balneolaceae bacterium]|nr:TIGR00725 family protein [Balneolaceae bacterium]